MVESFYILLQIQSEDTSVMDEGIVDTLEKYWSFLTIFDHPF